jgi:hypothetical protein
MRKIGIALALVVGAFFIARGVVELLTIDYSNPSSYADDWGGPSLVGVLLVHVGPGILALLMIGAFWRRSRTRTP